MSAESQAYAMLSADDDIVALVVDRVYPDFVPQDNALPAVAIIRTETDYVTTIHSGEPVAIQVTLEIWCLAATRLVADQLADTAMVTMTGSPGGFVPVGRRPETETGPPVQFATVLSLVCWE